MNEMPVSVFVYKLNLIFTYSPILRLGISTVVLPQKRIDRQINEDVRKMMIALFGILEPELNNFIVGFEKLDSLYV